MNAFAGIRAKGGGRNPTPLAFFPGVCSRGCFPVGIQPPRPPPANFYPGSNGESCTMGTLCASQII